MSYCCENRVVERTQTTRKAHRGLLGGVDSLDRLRQIQRSNRRPFLYTQFVLNSHVNRDERAADVVKVAVDG